MPPNRKLVNYGIIMYFGILCGYKKKKKIGQSKYIYLHGKIFLKSWFLNSMLFL